MICPVEDRLAIEDLAVAYAYAVDDIGNSEGVAALFAGDGVYDVSGFGLGEFVGRDAIRAFSARLRWPRPICTPSARARTAACST